VPGAPNCRVLHLYVAEKGSVGKAALGAGRGGRGRGRGGPATADARDEGPLRLRLRLAPGRREPRARR